MKVVILAGGRGTRLMEETKGEIPKPLLTVGDIPMIEHIVRIYAAHGHKNFEIAGGYLYEKLRDWAGRRFKYMNREFGVMNISVSDTGVETQTGGRLKRLADLGILGYEPFMMTYGDGMADVNIDALLEFHKERSLSGYQVTLTAVTPPSRFGALEIFDGRVASFAEKTQKEGWINGGFFVIEPETLNLVSGDMCRWEYDVLPVLAIQNRLAAYQHPGYFQMCDTWRDLQKLNQTFRASIPAPWLRMETNEKED